MDDRSEIYKNEVDINNDNESKSIIFSMVEDKSKVLDVGCACGDLGVALYKHKKCELYGMEYNPESIKIANKTKSYQKIYQIDLNNFDYDTYNQQINNFDYIIFGDVLEHLFNPSNVINQMKKLLKPNGFLIVSLPNIAHASILANLLVNNFEYTDAGILDKTHIHFFTYKSIAKFLSEHNLKILEYKYTTMGKYGWPRTNPYLFLPRIIKRYLFKNPHSFIWQYITKLQVEISNELLISNLEILREQSLSAKPRSKFEIFNLSSKYFLIKLLCLVTPVKKWRRELRKIYK